MSLRERLETFGAKPWRLLCAVLLMTVIAGGILVASTWSQASSTRFTLGGFAGVACDGYVNQVVNSNFSANPTAPTVVDAYPTTAGNLEMWLTSLDPFADPSVLQKLSTTTHVTACVLQDGGVLGSAHANYSVILVAPGGTAAPIMSGPSVIFTAAPPATGNS
jgi:hypothetical protein